jgi:hypothetical protein
MEAKIQNYNTSKIYQPRRRPQFVGKWKTTSIFFLKMEDYLNFCENGRRPHFFLNRRRLQFLTMEDVLIFLKVEDNPKKCNANSTAQET